MTKRYNLFNYAETWLGLFRFALGICAIFGAYFLFFSDDPLILRIFGSLLMIITLIACVAEGTDDIKKGIKKANSGSGDYLYGRDKRSSNRS